MRFLQETGIILNSFKDIVHIIDGDSGSVEFYFDLVWRLHSKSPGSVYCLVHTHPNGMTQLSTTDETTLKAQSIALAPFPVRMATVTLIDEYVFKTSIYLGLYQSVEDYLYRKQTGRRTFEIVLEKENYFFHSKLIPYLSSSDYSNLMSKIKNGHMSTYEKFIVERSFMNEQEKVNN